MKCYFSILKTFYFELLFPKWTQAVKREMNVFLVDLYKIWQNTVYVPGLIFCLFISLFVGKTITVAVMQFWTIADIIYA